MTNQITYVAFRRINQLVESLNGHHLVLDVKVKPVYHLFFFNDRHKQSRVKVSSGLGVSQSTSK